MDINFSSITVTFNEENHLDECLKALGFCDENVVIDLGSKDNSVKIAEQNNAKIYYHPRVEIIEKIRSYAVNLTSNNWFVFVDPDEIFPQITKKELIKIIKKYPDVGNIQFKIQNYFLNNPIKYGRWHPGFHAGFYRKDAVNFTDSVHRGCRKNNEYKTVQLENHLIKHYWVDSIEQFYEKHYRYLKYEGESRYKSNVRFSYSKMYYDLLKNFLRWYIKRSGILDIKNGLKLIKLAIWYEKNAWISLKKYEKNKKVILLS